MRKRLLSIVALFMSLVLFTSACSNSSPKGTEGSAKKKEINVAIFTDGAIKDLDAATFNGPHFLYKMLYEGFVEDGGAGKILPTLAKTWDISPDGKTYTFHLREGVKFSDGTDFNADAVIFNLKRWTNDNRHATLSSTYVDSMETVDKNTVKIVFKDASYPILMELTYPRPVRFLSPSSLKDGKFETPVGTGPWMLEKYEKGVEFTLVPNPYYWGEKPKVDRIRFKVITDAQARVLALKSGEVDMIGGDLVGKIPMESINELKKNSDFKVQTTGTMCSHFIAFNENNSVFKDKNVRLAMNYAVDKKSIATKLFDGNGLEAGGLYQSTVPYTTKDNNYGYAYDVSKAKKLLEDAGFVDSDGDGVREKGGKKLEFKLLLSTDEFPEWKPLAEYLQSQFSQVGIKINLSTLDKNGYNEASTNTRDFDITLMRTASDSWVPHSSLKELFYNLSGHNYAKVWTDDNLKTMISNVMLTRDETTRQAQYDKLFSYISSEAITIPVYYPITSFAVNTKKIDNFKIGVNNYAPVEWEKLTVK